MQGLKVSAHGKFHALGGYLARLPGPDQSNARLFGAPFCCPYLSFRRTTLFSNVVVHVKGMVYQSPYPTEYLVSGIRPSLLKTAVSESPYLNARVGSKDETPKGFRLRIRAWCFWRSSQPLLRPGARL